MVTKCLMEGDHSVGRITRLPENLGVPDVTAYGLWSARVTTNKNPRRWEEGAARAVPSQGSSTPWMTGAMVGESAGAVKGGCGQKARVNGATPGQYVRTYVCVIQRDDCADAGGWPAGDCSIVNAGARCDDAEAAIVAPARLPENLLFPGEPQRAVATG